MSFVGEVVHFAAFSYELQIANKSAEKIARRTL